MKFFLFHFILHFFVIFCYHCNLEGSKYVKTIENQLFINDPYITSIDPDSFKKYNKVTHLFILFTRLTQFPEGVEHLTNLKSIRFEANSKTTNIDALMKLPKELKNQIKTINLRKNNLKTLDDAICEFSNLEYLSIYDNDLTILPDSMEQLINLKTLDASRNNIEFLPDGLSNLKALEILHLDYNNITIIYPWLIKLQSLRELHLSYNNLDCIPMPLYFLNNLEELWLDNNKIEELYPAEEAWLEFKTHISQNEELNRYVDSSVNEFSQIFSKIKILDISFNILNTIPDQIKKCRNLMRLSACCNIITSLSQFTLSLPMLKVMHLSDNLIQYIPFSKQLTYKSFDYINLSKNCLSVEDAKSKGYGLKSLKKLFDNINTKNQYPNYFTLDEVIELYHKENNPHWIIEGLNNTVICNDAVEQAKHISDITMCRMWNKVLKYFVYKPQQIDNKYNDIINMKDIETNEIINKVMNSKVFNNLKPSDDTQESEQNRLFVDRMTEYIHTHMHDDDSTDSPNNIKVKSYMKLAMEQILKDIVNIATDIELNEIKYKVCTLCDIATNVEKGIMQNRCIVGQLEEALRCYTAYYLKSIILVTSKLDEFILQMIATIKELMFQSAVAGNHRQNVHDIAKWSMVFRNKLGIRNESIYEDPYFKESKKEQIMKTGEILLKFLKVFEISEVAEEIAKEVNKSKEYVLELKTVLIEFIENNGEAKKKQIQEVYDYVVTNYFEYKIEDEESEFRYKQPIAIKTAGMVKIFEKLGLIE